MLAETQNSIRSRHPCQHSVLGVCTQVFGDKLWHQLKNFVDTVEVPPCRLPHGCVDCRCNVVVRSDQKRRSLDIRLAKEPLVRRPVSHLILILGHVAVLMHRFQALIQLTNVHLSGGTLVSSSENLAEVLLHRGQQEGLVHRPKVERATATEQRTPSNHLENVAQELATEPKGIRTIGHGMECHPI